MIRLHVPDLILAVGERVAVVDERHHYLSRVMRVRPGVEVELFRGDGRAFRAEVTDVVRASTTFIIRAELPGTPPSPLAVTLFQALLKGRRVEAVVQKATELGVATIAFVQTERCVARDAGRGGRLDRLSAIAVEASEQCGRADVPTLLAPRSLAEILADPATGDRAFERRLLLWEGARDRSISSALADRGSPRRVAMLSGPEGGLSEAEAGACQAAGWEPVGLGPRILRAETAPLAALAVLQFALGDLGM